MVPHRPSQHPIDAKRVEEPYARMRRVRGKRGAMVGGGWYVADTDLAIRR